MENLPAAISAKLDDFCELKAPLEQSCDVLQTSRPTAGTCERGQHTQTTRQGSGTYPEITAAGIELEADGLARSADGDVDEVERVGLGILDGGSERVATVEAEIPPGRVGHLCEVELEGGGGDGSKGRGEQKGRHAAGIRRVMGG